MNVDNWQLNVITKLQEFINQYTPDIPLAIGSEEVCLKINSREAYVLYIIAVQWQSIQDKSVE